MVAHPPCKRWGRWWGADGSASPGNDNGLFELALNQVRQWGGVLEHPAHTHAWEKFNIRRPEEGCWSECWCGGWTTEVAQRNYGHRARKLTWLYASPGEKPVDLDWSKPAQQTVYLCAPGRRKGKPGRKVELMGAVEARVTPLPFAKLLIEIARGRGS